MSKKVLIYGINQQAQQLYYYISMEGNREIEAFIVDREYKTKKTLLGLPVVDFEDIEKKFAPSKYEILLSFGYKNIIRNRQEKYFLCKQKGYNLASYISKDAKVYTEDIGESVIIYPNTIIAPYVKIGNGCFIETSCNISHHTSIGDFNFFAPGTIVVGNVQIGNNCFFGAGSIIATQYSIGDRVVIGAGVCVTGDVKSDTAYRHAEGIIMSNSPEEYI